MTKRLRKQPDGTFHLNTVTPHPSGLSHAPDAEVTLLILTDEEVAQIGKDHADGLGPLDPPVSDKTPAKSGSGLSAAAE